MASKRKREDKEKEENQQKQSEPKKKKRKEGKEEKDEERPEAQPGDKAEEIEGDTPTQDGKQEKNTLETRITLDWMKQEFPTQNENELRRWVETLSAPAVGFQTLGDVLAWDDETLKGEFKGDGPGKLPLVCLGKFRQLRRVVAEAPAPSPGVSPDFPSKFEQRRPEGFALSAKIIGVERAVDNAMMFIEEHCPRETTETVDDAEDPEYRVPPVMVASLSRSGKTTTLKATFNRLLKDYSPIYVTFNEMSKFERKEGETDLSAFLRIVAGQTLMKSAEDAKELVCTRDELENYLNSEKPIVLLIDELNVLLRNQPPSDALAKLLRELFLDPPNRYLCFSSHWALDVIGDTRSGRGRCVVTVVYVTPTLENVALIRDQWSDQNREISLVQAEIAYFGGFLGLLYETKFHRFDPHTRFTNELKFLEKQPPPSELLEDFLRQFCTGRQITHLDTFYGRFTVRLGGEDLGSLDESVVWPLCYAEPFLHEAGASNLARLIHDAKVVCSVPSTNNGLEWEYIACLAVAFTLFAKMFEKKKCHGTYSRDILKLKDFGPKQLLLKRLDEEVETVSDACSEIEGSLQDGMMVFATSYKPDFPTFDAIIGWQVKKKIYFRGLQMKLTRGLPKKDAPSQIPGILLRGDPPEKGSPTRRKNWTYVTSSELKSFVPYSMQHLIPATWEQEDEKIEDEKEKKEEKKRKRERGDGTQEKPHESGTGSAPADYFLRGLPPYKMGQFSGYSGSSVPSNHETVTIEDVQDNSWLSSVDIPLHEVRSWHDFNYHHRTQLRLLRVDD